MKMLVEYSAELCDYEQREQVSRVDFDHYLEEEFNYLDNLRKEPQAITRRIEYVAALQKLAIIQ